MSRRKDLERVKAMQRLDPDYKGFRGHQEEPTRKAPLEAVVCVVCQHKRNVPRGIALEQGDHYVCMSCREKSEGEGAA
ncbi:MAG: hypothetical protein HYY00_01610 [Chloroflexi bacterium]|nr:hypothetical protein [Chloroflexota bacterium]